MEIISSPIVKLVEYTPNAEQLIAKAAKRCYFGPEFENMNDTSLSSYLKKVKDRGHLSVFEHASATFDIQNVSRIFLAQHTRHRVASFSVESQRYRNQQEFDLVLPPDLVNSSFRNEIIEEMLRVKDLYSRMIESGIKKEDARYILPNGGTTSLIFTANFRELLHYLELREDPHAQLEIRVVAQTMRLLLKQIAPNVF